MKLKCRINEQEYDIVSGATFSEEYSETLDSGTIILDHIPKIPNLKPYDDVYIWNSDEPFIGYYNVGDEVPFGSTEGEFSYEITTNSNHNYETEYSNLIVTAKENSYILTGFIVGIWYSILFKNIGTDRWNLSGLPFKFTLKNIEDGTTTYGYYYLSPNTHTDMAVHCYRDDNQPYDSNAPLMLLINTAEISNDIVLADTVGYKVSLSKDIVGFNSTSITDSSIPFEITNLEKVPNASSQYTYIEDSAIRKYLIATFSNFSRDDMLGLRDLVLEGNIYGGFLSLKSEKPVLVNNSRIDITFSTTLSSKEIINHIPVMTRRNYSLTMYFYYIDEEWEAEPSLQVAVRRVGSNGRPIGHPIAAYHFDTITTNPVSQAYFSISSSLASRQQFPSFFKHLLVDSYTCDMVDLDNENYKYKITLMSETKRLEKIILPNISITQPIVGEKRTIWYYLNQYVKLYSPKVKTVDRNGKWIYKEKYHIDAREIGDRNIPDEYFGIPLHEIFDDTIYAPELSLTAPNLRDILSKLMIVKDCIPVVRNDVIYAMKISDTHGAFNTDSKTFSFITESMNSSNYSTAFRREYGNAISQKNSTHMVEYLGFRNYESVLMTLDNMYLETRFPIYKINSLYMCYYKKVTVTNTEEGRTYDKIILVRQDISKLVLQNTVRDALPADWTIYSSGAWHDLTTDEMSKYRVLTLGYDIGSNRITGWGEKLSYLADVLGWSQATYTYLEIILDLIEQNVGMFGEQGLQFLGDTEQINSLQDLGWRDAMVTPVSSSNVTNKLKAIFFQMDYIGMYSGAVIHSKENTDNDDFQTSDNCSAALSILEVDGLFEKEKANRLGNSEISFIARYNSVDEMNSSTHNNILGAVYDDNVIVFHREYQIYDDCVLANFVGSYDYVMKNYFTTVFAKYRTYSYASYTENISRTENDKYMVVLSDDNCIYEEESTTNNLLNVTSILSGFSESFVGNDLHIYFTEQINGGYFSFEGLGEYFSDVNTFVVGYSLCFNIRTFGTITSGNYISSINCYEEGGNSGTYIGSAQNWYKMTENEADGFIETIGCYFGHFSDDDFVINNVEWSGTASDLYAEILQLPLKNRTPTFSFGKEYNFCKDEKEVLDFTLQYELVNQDKDILVSEWLMKLTDFNNYTKFSTEKQIKDINSEKKTVEVHFGSKYVNWNAALVLIGGSGLTYKRQFKIFISDAFEEFLTDGATLNGCYNRMPYFASFTAQNQQSSTTVTTYMFIGLEQIMEVVRSGSSITQLKIRVVCAQNIWAVTGMASADTGVGGTSTQILTFNAMTSDVPEGYLGFFWEGQELPANDAWQIKVSLHNGLDSDDPEIRFGSLMPQPENFTFEPTMYIIASKKKMERSMVYSQYDINNLPDDMTIIPLSDDNTEGGCTFQDIFSIEEDEHGRPYIHFKANELLGDDYQSIQYWYHDVNGDNYLHFVFGVNRTREQGDANIFISILKNRDKRVYNVLHRKIGTVLNCAEPENADRYGEQYYEEDD